MKMKGFGQVGYVANSPYTVIGESCSADRLNLDGNSVPIKDMAHYLNLIPRTIRDRVSKLEDEFFLDKGIVRAE